MQEVECGTDRRESEGEMARDDRLMLAGKEAEVSLTRRASYGTRLSFSMSIRCAIDAGHANGSKAP